MAKFKVQKYNQAYMARLGLHSYNLTEPTIEFHRAPFTYYVLIVGTIASVSVLAFLNSSPELKEAFLVFKIAAGGVQTIISFFAVAFEMVTIKTLHLKLQEIVDEVDEKEVDDIYWNTEQKCRRFTLRIGIYVIVHSFEFVILLSYAAYCMFHGNFDPHSWPLFFTLYLPFDEYASIFNWSMALFIELNLALLYCFGLTSVTSYFVCCCMYMDAMCEHVNYLIRSVDRIQKTSRDRVQVIQTFKKAVQLHVKMIEAIDLVSTIVSGPIFSILPANAVFMSVTLLGAEQTFGEFEVFASIFDISCLTSSLLWPTFFCFYANDTTTNIASIADIVYGSHWYEWPPELSKYTQLIISRSQDPVFFMGYGLVRCTLEVFANLMRSSFSFFMLYRTVAYH